MTEFWKAKDAFAYFGTVMKIRDGVGWREVPTAASSRLA